MQTYKTLYPAIEPNTTGWLPVDSLHHIYWETSGNPKGQPVIFLHGGPGGGTDAKHRSYFNPERYHIVLMDQRGCGKSKPFSALENNTTWHLVDDIEKLKTHLHIKKWVVFGGSWGSTLALTYAATHPDSVDALIVRGIFLGRPQEINWFYKPGGTSQLFPDAFEKFIAPIPLDQRDHLLETYYTYLTSNDASVRQKAANAWSAWEAITAKLQCDEAFYSTFTESTHADALARIECHYFVNHLFFETPNWILNQASAFKTIPGIIIHGRYDVICPTQNAWDLHQAWPKATLEIIPAAGHAASEPGITDALVRATDAFST